MRSRAQLLSALVVAAAVTAGGLYLDREVGTRPLEAALVTTSSSGSWLCPHGGGPGWEVQLHLANPGGEPVDVRVRGLGSSKPTRAEAFTVEPGAHLVVPAEAGGRDRSSVIEYFGGWVAAGWVAHAGGGEGGVAAEPCLPAADRTWLLPEATAAEKVNDDFVVVMNPFAIEAVVTLTLYTEDRTIATAGWTNVVLRPRHSAAFRLNLNALGDSSVATRIDVKVGRVAAATLGIVETGGIRSSVGIAGGPGSRRILPGGFDQGNSDLVVANVRDERAALEGRLLSREAVQPLTSFEEATVNRSSALTLPVSTEGPSTIDLTPAPGVVAGRRTLGAVSDQGSTNGTSEAASAWIVLPATAGAPAHPGLVLANPGDEPARVTLSFLAGEGAGVPAPVTLDVPAGSTVAAPREFVDPQPMGAVLAVAESGTFVPTSASYSLGREGYATYAVSLGVPVPLDRVSLGSTGS